MTADGGEPSPHPSVRLVVTPEPRLLGTVRLVVATAGRRAGLNDELVADLKVAVSEICSNAIRESEGDPDARIEVDLFENGDRFGVEIRDRCQSDGRPGRLPSGAADDRDFGLALVGSLVDELDAERRPDGGYVTRFWLSPARRTGDLDGLRA